MGMITAGLMSSNTDEWPTPSYVFDPLDREFGFDVDVCADADNRKCAMFYSKEQDGLRQEWKGTCWMNPPYGRTIGQWVKKAYESARGGGRGCLLVAGSHGHSLVEGLRHACK